MPGMEAEARSTRRRLLGTAGAVAAAGALAACGLAPPGPVILAVAGETVAEGLLSGPYRAHAPGVRLRFLPWPPPAGTSVAALDADRFGDPATRAGLLPLDARLSLVAFSPSGVDPGPWAAFSAAGAQLGVPMVQSRLVVLYDGAAVPRPAPGWTFTDLLATLGAAGAAGRPALADLAGVRVDVWNALTVADGGSLAGPGDRLPTPAPGAAVRAWQDFALLQGHARPGSALGPGGAAAALRFFPLPADVAALQGAGMRVGVAAFPGPAVPARTRGHGIVQAAPEPGSALEFVVWAGEPLAQQTLRASGYVPAARMPRPAPPPLGARAGEDPSALLPDPRADTFLPPPLRLSAQLRSAFEAELGAAPPGLSVEAAAAAYARAAGAAGPGD